MSKTKQKNSSEVEHLRGLVKKLTSENTKLRRQNKHLERKSYHFETIVDEVVEEVEMASSCENCGKGDLMVLDLKYVTIETCTVCDFKRNLKNGKEIK